MKLTIITATYNSARTVQNCLQSVAQQDRLHDVEHIIVDGGSRDETLEIVGQFPHVCRVVSEPDNGIYDAFNKGIRLAQGEFIYFLNSDDRLLSSAALNPILDKCENPGNQYVLARVRFSDPASKAVWTQNSRKLQFGELLIEQPCHQGFFIRTALIKSMGGFPDDFSIAADSYVMLKALTSVKGEWVDEAVTLFDRGGFSSDLERMQQLEEELECIYRLIGVKPVLPHNNWMSQKNFVRSKHLMLAMLDQSALKPALKASRVAIAGTGQMSVLVAKILLSHGVSLVGFVTTAGSKESCLGLKVYSVTEHSGAEVVVSGIEGEHFTELNARIQESSPGVEFLRWYELYED